MSKICHCSRTAPPVRYGDTILLHLSESNGLVPRAGYFFSSCSVKDSKIVIYPTSKEDPVVPNIRSVTFKVVPALNYKAASKYRSLKTFKSDTDETTKQAKNDAELEEQENRDLVERKNGLVVYYGDAIQLQHTITKEYISVSTKKPSLTEFGRLKVYPRKEIGKGCIFRILKNHSMQSFCSTVHYQDKLKFESNNIRGQYLRSSAVPYDDTGMTAKCYEVNLAATTDAVITIFLHSEAKIHTEYQDALKGGATIRLVQQKTKHYVVADFDLTQKGEVTEYVHFKQQEVYSEYSPNKYWQIELCDDKRSGKLLSWNHECRIKHRTAQKYLSIMCDDKSHYKACLVDLEQKSEDTKFQLVPAIEKGEIHKFIATNTKFHIKHVRTKNFLQLRSDETSSLKYQIKQHDYSGQIVPSRVGVTEALSFEIVEDKILQKFNKAMVIVSSLLDEIKQNKDYEAVIFLLEKAKEEVENKCFIKICRNMKVIPRVLLFLRQHFENNKMRNACCEFLFVYWSIDSKEHHYETFFYPIIKNKDTLEKILDDEHTNEPILKMLHIFFKNNITILMREKKVEVKYVLEEIVKKLNPRLECLTKIDKLYIEVLCSCCACKNIVEKEIQEMIWGNLGENLKKLVQNCGGLFKIQIEVLDLIVHLIKGGNRSIIDDFCELSLEKIASNYVSYSDKKIHALRIAEALLIDEMSKDKDYLFPQLVKYRHFQSELETRPSEVHKEILTRIQEDIKELSGMKEQSDIRKQNDIKEKYDFKKKENSELFLKMLDVILLLLDLYDLCKSEDFICKLEKDKQSNPLSETWLQTWLDQTWTDFDELPSILVHIMHPQEPHDVTHLSSDVKDSILKVIERCFSCELSLFRRASNLYLYTKECFVEELDITVLKNALTHKEVSDCSDVVKALTEECYWPNESHLPNIRNQTILEKTGIISDILVYLKISEDSKKSRKREQASLHEDLSEESREDRLYEDCFRVLNAVAFKNLEAQKRLSGHMELFISCTESHPKCSSLVGKLLADIFSSHSDHELTLKVKEKYIIHILQKIFSKRGSCNPPNPPSRSASSDLYGQEEPWYEVSESEEHGYEASGQEKPGYKAEANGQANFTSALLAYMKINCLDLPIKHNQVIVSKHFSSIREDSQFCIKEILQKRGRGKTDDEWLSSMLLKDEHDTELQQLLMMTDILASCSEGRNSEVEAVCCTVYTIEELIKVISNKEIQSYRRRPFVRFLTWVYINTDNLKKLPDCLRGQEVCTLIDQQLEVISETTTKLNEKDLYKDVKPRLYSSEWKYCHSKTKSLSQEEIEIGILTDNILYITEGLIPLLNALFSNKDITALGQSGLLPDLPRILKEFHSAAFLSEKKMYFPNNIDLCTLRQLIELRKEWFGIAKIYDGKKIFEEDVTYTRDTDLNLSLQEDVKKCKELYEKLDGMSGYVRQWDEDRDEIASAMDLYNCERWKLPSDPAFWRNVDLLFMKGQKYTCCCEKLEIPLHGKKVAEERATKFTEFLLQSIKHSFKCYKDMDEERYSEQKRLDKKYLQLIRAVIYTQIHQVNPNLRDTDPKSYRNELFKILDTTVKMITNSKLISEVISLLSHPCDDVVMEALALLNISLYVLVYGPNGHPQKKKRRKKGTVVKGWADTHGIQLVSLLQDKEHYFFKILKKIMSHADVSYKQSQQLQAKLKENKMYSKIRQEDLHNHQDLIGTQSIVFTEIESLPTLKRGEIVESLEMDLPTLKRGEIVESLEMDDIKSEQKQEEIQIDEYEFKDPGERPTVTFTELETMATYGSESQQKQRTGSRNYKLQESLDLEATLTFSDVEDSLEYLRQKQQVEIDMETDKFQEEPTVTLTDMEEAKLQENQALDIVRQEEPEYIVQFTPSSESVAYSDLGDLPEIQGDSSSDQMQQTEDSRKPQGRGPESDDSEIIKKKVEQLQDMSNINLIMDLLSQMCDGQKRDVQDYLRVQKGSFHPIDIVGVVTNFLASLGFHIHGFHTRISFHVCSRILRTLLEMSIGNNENKKVIFDMRIIQLINYILQKRFTHSVELKAFDDLLLLKSNALELLETLTEKTSSSDILICQLGKSLDREALYHSIEDLYLRVTHGPVGVDQKKQEYIKRALFMAYHSSLQLERCKEIKKHISDKAWKYCESRSQSVEVVMPPSEGEQKGTLVRTHFYNPYKDSIRPKVKNYLKWNINRESAPEKKRSLISWTKDIKNDILHYHRYRHSRTKCLWMFKRFPVFLQESRYWILLLLTLLLNLFVVINFRVPPSLLKNNNNESTVIVMPEVMPWFIYTLYVFGSIHIFFAVWMCIEYFVVNKPNFVFALPRTIKQFHFVKLLRKNISSEKWPKLDKFLDPQKSHHYEVNILGIRTIYILVFVACSIASLPLGGYLYCVCSLYILVDNDVLQRAIKSFTRHFKTFCWVGALIISILFIYAVISFAFFNRSFAGEGLFCDTLGECFVTVIRSGLLDTLGSAIGLGNKTFAQAGWRFVFDISFFIVINTIFLNVIFGIILDTYGELRNERFTNRKDMNSCCFICGIAKDTFDKQRGGFSTHVTKEHSMWTYITYYIYLYRLDPNDHRAVDSYVYGQICEDKIDFFPDEQALSEMTASQDSKLKIDSVTK